MIDGNDLKTIKETTQEFFLKTGLDIDLDFLPSKKSNIQGGQEEIFAIQLNITAKEPQILIGERGQTLSEIQHLLKSVLKRKIDKQFFLELDINDYKKKKADYLRELARLEAEGVTLSKQEKAFPPMTAYERRIIHLELADHPNIIAESAGEEPDRKIIIKPKP